MIFDVLWWGVAIAASVAAGAAAGHALLNKRDPRAALGWIGFSLAVPFIGPLGYFFFGVNRIRTTARTLSGLEGPDGRLREFASSHADLPSEYSELAGIAAAVSNFDLVGGNKLEILHNGEEAYPAMLEEIDRAEHHVLLTSYIFETNRTGLDFIEALTRAAARGLDTRVLLDGIGEYYSSPRAGKILTARGVSVARFLPPSSILPEVHINLRNHRKMLVADGRVAFAGGMNIGDRHLAARSDNPDRVVDTNFRITGPVVAQLQRVFLEDWSFTTGDELTDLPADLTETGGARCRTIVDGPNEDLDKLLVVLVGAVSAARKRVAIVTPYFIPPRELVGALQAAALRGVSVSVILPAKNNLPPVRWASRNMLWEVLQRGVRVFEQPPPFVHTKLFLVDDHYVQIGSANVDPRSLRLNFEMVVEVYDRGFAATVGRHFDEVQDRSHEVTLDEVDSRSPAVRVRDGLAWLFSPYL